MNFSDMLQTLNILRTSNQIRLVDLFGLFLCVWVGSSGFVHLVENSGDPFFCYENAKQLSIWNSLYLLVITMSTVGYGDITCQTVLGKIFILVFLFGAIALFATSVPEIIEIMNSTRQKHLVEYTREQGIRHLIVGGHISHATMKNFVRDFIHDDRLNVSLKSIVLDEREPSLELESLFKRYYNRMAFVKGSMMIIKDLKRVKLLNAEMVLILTNQSTKSADDEDTNNIMRAIAVKNYCPDAKVILQLLKIESKTICKNLPFWTSRDHIICFTEMKMAFMAAGCLAPGFSTFLSNLLLMYSYKNKNRERITSVDKTLYEDEDAPTSPSDINNNEALNFVRETSIDMESVRLPLLHSNLEEQKNHPNERSSSAQQPVKPSSPPPPPSASYEQLEDELVEEFDATGYFYWTPARNLDQCLLGDDRSEQRLKKLKDHIILCLSQQSMGSLRSFILPLRSSSLTPAQLHTIVIVTENKLGVEKEWNGIQNFPKIFIKIASPFNRGVLRSISIEKCRMCVVHAAQTGASPSDCRSDDSSDPDFESVQEDSKALLITLNIKNMTLKNMMKKHKGTAFNLLHRQFFLFNDYLSSNKSINKESKIRLCDSIPLLTELSTSILLNIFGRVFLKLFRKIIIFNPETYNLIRLLVTGSDTDDHDLLLAEGLTEQSCQMREEELLAIRSRCTVTLLPLNQGILSPYAKDVFEKMFTNVLSKNGILCIGLYRLLCPAANIDANNRFVITRPPPDMILLDSDKVYCLCPHALIQRDMMTEYTCYNLPKCST
ncbi:hypothetical protein HELRODRAFT_191034 [Helobdella robusta]|uniref:Calcium-activated potassium channel BK alpha subunit domain-containing protein n=1 Tax=Helobdella robusta TaxID=6412 RepID=T1FSI8_HELRO|nr:hypothetical protein HELRODRAFT_191034 [Helobdella robusta]ESO07771.1 hypothetical protein HELRODRAFT_191034 [Helobdella robusta]